MTDRRSNEPEGYDEYARKPKAQRRYSDPQDASISELNKADLSRSLGFGDVPGIHAPPDCVPPPPANRMFHDGEPDLAIPPNWTVGKPRVRVDTMIGGHSKAEYTRVLFVHAQHTFVQWKTNARDAWGDFARRLRLGQP